MSDVHEYVVRTGATGRGGVLRASANRCSVVGPDLDAQFEQDALEILKFLNSCVPMGTKDALRRLLKNEF